MSILAGGLIVEAAMGVSVASVFTDNMVLQRDMPVPVWGAAKPGESVTVSFGGQSRTGKADVRGRWMVKLDPLPASPTPSELTVRGEDGSRCLKNVLVGEVWICSGQSNMEFPVRKVIHAEREPAEANRPEIRLFSVPYAPADSPVGEMEGAEWRLCTPETVSGFSAVGYFFGRELQEKLRVPVGLINCSWGGTKAQGWISEARLKSIPELQSEWEAFDSRRSASGRCWPKGIYESDPLKRGWANPKLPDKNGWKPMQLPAKWQQHGIDASGIIWFRREVALPKHWLNHNLQLSLGAIDKTDVTYFNGEPIGATGTPFDQTKYSQPRMYLIPHELTRAGENAVAVRVRSEFFDGGMTGPADAMTLSCPDFPDDPPQKLAGEWRYAIEQSFGICSPGLPSELFNGMVNPLIPYAMRGVLWYQGESNEDRPELYRKLLPVLIHCWRDAWKEGNFPFLIVQLANFGTPETFDADSRWAVLREAQASAAASLPNVGLATAIDIGDPGDIHPTDKQEVGRRLAANALAEVYGLKTWNGRGPVFKSAKAEGHEFRVLFGNTDGELRCSDSKPLCGFVVAGKDGKFHPAEARIDGDSVLLSSELVPVPCAARYDWADSPVGNLRNRHDLPAEPFRSDAP